MLFYVPLIYSYKTRFIRPIKFISWIFIYIVPLLMLVALSSSNFTVNTIFAFFLVVMNTYNIYELGYIFNDTETIKNEKAPTLRLVGSQLAYYENNKALIYFLRLALSAFIIFVISAYFSDIVFVKLVTSVSLLLLMIFYIYNNVRGIVNLPLHFLLVFFRFSMVPAVFILDNHYFLVLFLSILLFPLINLFERCGERRFGLTFFQHSIFINRAKFRVLYYTLMIPISMLFYLVDGSLLFIPFIYFLMYRYLSVNVVKL